MDHRPRWWVVFFFSQQTAQQRRFVLFVGQSAGNARRASLIMRPSGRKTLEASSRSSERPRGTAGNAVRRQRHELLAKEQHAAEFSSLGKASDSCACKFGSKRLHLRLHDLWPDAKPIVVEVTQPA